MAIGRKLRLNQKQIDEIVSQYRRLQNEILTEREYPQEGYSEREPFARDYSRILYSSAFRRLQGKMQIMGVKSSSFYRNRLTHSLEVEQIAHSIAKLIALSCNMEWGMYNDDIFVIHAAALAHDIGHPAFGHKGERVLNELSRYHGAHFEGNAQNFRILRKLEKKDATNTGLNLTWRTLLAINKYLVKESGNVKKYIYKDDFDKLSKIRKDTDLANCRTLDVQIIELADDIAYAVHDLDDALSLNLFNIDDLLYEYAKDPKYPHCYKQLKIFVEGARQYAFNSNTYGIQEEYDKVFRCKLVSLLTDNFIHDITIKSVKDKDAHTHGTPNHVQELQLDQLDDLCHTLKDKIFAGVMRSPEVTLYELKGEAIIKSLFFLFAIDSRNENCRLLPMEYRPKEVEKDNQEDKIRYNRERILNSIDYIAGMMDTYAIKEYEKYFSTNFDSISLKEIEKIDKEIRKNSEYEVSKLHMKINISGQNALAEFSKSTMILKRIQNEAIS